MHSDCEILSSLFVIRPGNTTIDTIDDQVTQVENLLEGYEGNYPVRPDGVGSVICEHGTMCRTADLRKFISSSPCLFIVISGQILHKANRSFTKRVQEMLVVDY